MTPASHDTRRIRLLAINLALLALCLVSLVAAIVLYRLAIYLRPAGVPEASSTARPSFTPSLTASFTATSTITRTPRASLTPTIPSTATALPTASLTPTPTSLPTLTPARAAAQPGGYTLAEWSPEQADYMARLAASYPNTLLANAQDEEDLPAAYAAFEYPVLALREALLRYPNDPLAEGWRWSLAYDLTQLGSAEAGRRYAGLLADGLNRGDTDLAYLYNWFALHEPRLALYMVELDAPQGFTGSYLVELRGEGGSAFAWLLQSSRGYQALPLLTRFDYIGLPQANWVLENFSGEEPTGREVAIYFSRPPERFVVDPPQVASLAEVPPSILRFQPEESIFPLGVEFVNRWLVSEGEGAARNLTFQSEVFPACPVTVRLEYGWDGQNFASQGQSFTVQPSEKTLAYCEMVADHAAAVWGPAAAISIMEALLPFWPPAADVQGQPYPLDTRDGWLYRLGVYRALLGEMSVAIDYLTQVSTQPSVPDSRWIQPARDFLAVYQAQQDIYRACLTSAQCDPAYAIDYLVKHLPEGEDAFEYLKQAGVNPNSSGYFDFDADGEKERWFTVRHRPRQAAQFWILAKYLEGVQALQVSTVESVPPSLEYLQNAYLAEEGLSQYPAVFLEGNLAFNMRRMQGSQQPYIQEVPLRKEYPSRFFVPLEQAERRLFAGAPPAAIQADLLYLAQNPGLLCKPTWTCDRYYYLLGLASELAGDETTAVKAYHHLWSDYSQSAYTMMARLKLEGAAAAPTPTPSLTPTPTLPGTPTPTITGTPPTPTPTLTVTGTPPTATPTLTPTLTVTGTPPTATPTATQQAGEPYPTPPYP
jgi:hypothetical protein